MEDAHRIEIPFGSKPPFNDWSFFAVFDGHSSKQIAKGAAANIVEALFCTRQFQEVCVVDLFCFHLQQFSYLARLRRTVES